MRNATFFENVFYTMDSKKLSCAATCGIKRDKMRNYTDREKKPKPRKGTEKLYL